MARSEASAKGSLADTKPPLHTFGRGVTYMISFGLEESVGLDYFALGHRSTSGSIFPRCAVQVTPPSSRRV